MWRTGSYFLLGMLDIAKGRFCTLFHQNISFMTGRHLSRQFLCFLYLLQQLFPSWFATLIFLSISSHLLSPFLHWGSTSSNTHVWDSECYHVHFAYAGRSVIISYQGLPAQTLNFRSTQQKRPSRFIGIAFLPRGSAFGHETWNFAARFEMTDLL